MSPLVTRWSIVKWAAPAAIGAAALLAAAQAQGVWTSPYVYGYGPQGLGYYLVPGAIAPAAPTAPVAAPAAAPTAAPRLATPAPTVRSSGGGSVGPGARNWATGNRVPSHRPWLRSRS